MAAIQRQQGLRHFALLNEARAFQRHDLQHVGHFGVSQDVTLGKQGAGLCVKRPGFRRGAVDRLDVADDLGLKRRHGDAVACDVDGRRGQLRHRDAAETFVRLEQAGDQAGGGDGPCPAMENLAGFAEIDLDLAQVGAGAFAFRGLHESIEQMCRTVRRGNHHEAARQRRGENRFRDTGHQRAGNGGVHGGATRAQDLGGGFGGQVVAG